MGVYITNKQMKAWSDLIEWTKHQRYFSFSDDLVRPEQDIIVNAEVALIKATRRKIDDNERAKLYMREKRSVDRHYGR